MRDSDPGIIPPGQTQDFIYTGMEIPNQVNVANLDSGQSAEFKLTSDGGWSLFGLVDPGSVVSLLVQWPSGRASVTNLSVTGAGIDFYGDGIFPASEQL